MNRITTALCIVVILAACAPIPGDLPDIAPISSTPTPIALPTVTFTPTTTSTPETPTTLLPLATLTDTSTATPFPTETPTPVPVVRFAVIGDYGHAGLGLEAIARLIQTWHVDLIITTGDNNYPSGAASSIDQNIGQYFHQYISPYIGSYGEGSDTNRYFPSLGNHDWISDNAQPYLDYFTLPGNERYYSFSWGVVGFFALDSDEHEPDGVAASSLQATWLEGELTVSPAIWKIVYMHHPPYSSGLHGSTTWMRWPFAEWGATTVLAGHDHTYERLLVDNLPYFIVGSSGYSLYNFVDILEGSLVRYNADFGAMLVEAGEGQISFQFYNQYGELVDSYAITRP